MANKQQRQYKKLNIKTGNGGASPIVGPIEHGPNAFLKPEQAIQRLRENGIRSWKTKKR
jgi:hypothetical protein